MLKIIINNIKKNFSLSEILYFLPLIIIFSSLKIYGYVLFFLFYLPYLFRRRIDIFTSFKELKSNQKISFYYFIFILLQVFHGAFFLKDYRVLIYWIPFIIVLSSAYLLNLFQLKFDAFYRKNYIRIIYKSSLIYFVFYFLMNVWSYYILGDFYKLQDYFWMGSSGAFAIGSLFFLTLFKLWEENNFSLNSIYLLSFIFFIFLVEINESRLGLLYVLIFSSFLILKNIKIGKLSNAFIITFLIFSVYQASVFFVDSFHILSQTYIYKIDSSSNRNLISDTNNILSIKDKRKQELIKGYKKFEDYSLINKFIGTGWYSSRITMNLSSDELNNYQINHSEKKAYSLQGIVALILDTGIIGILFLFVLYSKTFYYLLILKKPLLNRMLYISLLAINFACLFIGYPLVNLAYILFLMPYGIINLEDNKL
tara:strand:+ start:2599 stop:3873 length:1275 start_codon:yes stop_codon:yes gene_type:complete